VRKGFNEHQLLPIARHFKASGIVVRFIEFMDVGSTNGWNLGQVVSGRQIVERICAELPLQPTHRHQRSDVAERYVYEDGSGEIGVITSVTQPFCGACTRARLSAEGKLYTCLFASGGHDLRPVLRDGGGEAELVEFIREVWQGRVDRYSAERTNQTDADNAPKIEMSYIGG
jgi:cyclic pyranopterin phosphate synthase